MMLRIARRVTFRRRVLGIIAMALCLSRPLSSQETQDVLFGGSYRTLRPEQKALIDRWTHQVARIVGSRPDPEKSYDQLPLSSRTTFEAVTHALLRSNLTDNSGKPLGRAIDLIDVVERIAGKVDGVRGDNQFRVYVYLKRGAVKKLYEAREFQREHDNTVFHIGYPINFRQQDGAPSVQFSVARTGQRADIDVDYRSSARMKALFNGHLSATNSDVRAGSNLQTHNARWSDLGNWWQSVLASVFGNDPARADASANLSDGGPIVPPVDADWERAARNGQVYDAVHAYAQQWLVARDPIGVLRAISIKAYPCVAEYRDGSRPDSRLALYRILAQMKRANAQIGTVSDLADVVEPVDYPLPDARPIAHPHSNLFSLQLVPDDVAWALDCRLRYRLDMAEAVPQPSHASTGVYAVTFRYKQRSDANEFRVQFWQKQSGEWKLVSFDIKHSPQPPPADVVARTARGQAVSGNQAARPAVNAPAAEQVQAIAVQALTAWLKDRNASSALESFAPESYACDAFEDDSAPVPPSPGDRDRLLKSLTTIANEMGGGDRLEAVIEAPEAAHPQMDPIPHARSGAFLLARISDDLLKMRLCSRDPRARVQPSEATGTPTHALDAYVTAFQSVKAEGENQGTVLLFWRKLGGDWRVVAYAVDTD